METTAMYCNNKEMIIDERQVLLSHPYGSIKPNETFYKSIFLHSQK